MNTLIAVGVGYHYAIVPIELVSGIQLTNTHSIVTNNFVAYPLYKGKTFEDSQKIDEILDRADVTEYKIYQPLDDGEVTFEVTFARTGVAFIKCRPDQVHEKANALTEADITWTDDWSVTDVQETENE